MPWMLAALLLPLTCLGSGLERVSERPFAHAIRGAQLLDGMLYTWGDGLFRWSGEPLSAKQLAAGAFGEHGCVGDFDADGGLEFLTQRGAPLGDLVLRSIGSRDEREQVVDTEIGLGDCLQADLFGRRGVLLIHRGAQLRFYWQQPGQQAWASRDIYSIYTPSEQAGLALHDVDGDGRMDIFCGNYWLQAPAQFSESWRLFAINTYSETPPSASMRLAKAGDDLVVAQTRLPQAKVTWFRKPENPQAMWREQVLTDAAVFPRGLAVLDFDGDGELDVVTGEQAALRWFRRSGGRVTKIGNVNAAKTILLVPWSQHRTATVRERRSLLQVTASGLVFWRFR